VRRSCKNVTFGAPIHAEGERTSQAEDERKDALLSVKRRLKALARTAGGGWRTEGDANGAANVTFGATNVTPYTYAHYETEHDFAPSYVTALVTRDNVPPYEYIGDVKYTAKECVALFIVIVNDSKGTTYDLPLPPARHPERGDTGTARCVGSGFEPYGG